MLIVYKSPKIEIQNDAREDGVIVVPCDVVNHDLCMLLCRLLRRTRKLLSKFWVPIQSGRRSLKPRCVS